MPLGSQQHKSRCVYCSSVNYGKGCRFGPHGVHFHPDDSTKCSFCGSPDYGKGCRVNPTGNLHIHGGVYNNMYKEAVEGFLSSKILLKHLKQDYKSFLCYKLGIINESGEKIRQPQTAEEHASYDSYTKTIFKLKKYIGSKIDLLEAHTSLERNLVLQESPTEYQRILEFQSKIDLIVNELYKTIEEAEEKGISAEKILKA